MAFRTSSAATVVAVVVAATTACLQDHADDHATNVPGRLVGSPRIP